jgi:hypothetical protein
MIVILFHSALKLHSFGPMIGLPMNMASAIMAVDGVAAGAMTMRPCDHATP